MSAEPQERAIAEYRAAHPGDDDLPDEVLAKLFVVQSRALGIALTDLGHEVFAARYRIIAMMTVVWLVVLAVSLFVLR